MEKKHTQERADLELKQDVERIELENDQTYELFAQIGEFLMTEPSALELCNPRPSLTGNSTDDPALIPLAQPFYTSSLPPNRDYLIPIKGLTVAPFTQRFSTGLGTLYAPDIKLWGFNSSLHFHPVPINRNEDLRGANLLKRISLFAGIVFQDLGANTEVDIEKRFALGNPVLGVSLRAPFYGWRRGSEPAKLANREFLQVFRVDVGWIFFQQKDANPIVNKLQKKSTFFVSLTVEIELKEVLGPLKGLFGGG